MNNKEMWRISKHFCSTIQVEEEIVWAMGRIKSYIGRPLRNFLEIGLHGGGSLCMWSQIVAEDGQLYGITLFSHPEHKDFMEVLVPVLTGKQISIIPEASELETTKARLLQMLNGDKLDAIFIDSLHTAEQSEKEFEMYSPLVIDGGVIAFHDVVPKPEGGSTGDYYQKMKFDHVYEEFRCSKDHPNMGIGLILT